ncbi:MAG: ATP-binding protein [Candidatus Micrarchaeia archaeon]
MFLKKLFRANSKSVGTVERRLSISKLGVGRLHWRWSRVFFKNFYIGNNEINRHILIVGESGSGKSNACKQIIRSLSADGSNFIVFDPHDEYIDLAKETEAKVYNALYTGINLFDLDGMSIKERTGELTELFRRIFRLGEVQSYMLYKLILYTYNFFSESGKVPNINSLVYSIKVFKRHATKGEVSILNSLEKRFLMLGSELSSRYIGIDDLLSSRSVFAISSLHTSEAQAVYIEGFLRKIYSSMLSSERTSTRRFYIIIDEVEKLGQSNIIGRLAAEGRKYNIGIIALSQHAKQVEKNLRGNASTIIAFYQREPEELNYISNMISSGNELERFSEVKKAMRRLRQGHAVVMSSLREPIIVRFYLLEGAKEASHYIMQLAKRAVKKENLLSMLATHGFNEQEAFQSIDFLVKEGVLRYYNTGAKGYEGTWYMVTQRNGAEHDILVDLISRHLTDLGIGNRIYNSAFGPDIIARIGNARVAVEYETGKNNFEKAEAMIKKRLDNFSKVFVIVNDTEAERYLHIEGVRVFRASEFLSIEDNSVFLQGAGAHGACTALQFSLVGRMPIFELRYLLNSKISLKKHLANFILI